MGVIASVPLSMALGLSGSGGAWRPRFLTVSDDQPRKVQEQEIEPDDLPVL